MLSKVLLLLTAAVAAATIGLPSATMTEGSLELVSHADPGQMMLSDADSSPFFGVSNSGNYVIKLTCQWFDNDTKEIGDYQSGGVPLGQGTNLKFAESDQSITCSVNIDMIFFPEIFQKSYKNVTYMEKECTNFIVQGGILDATYAPACSK